MSYLAAGFRFDPEWRISLFTAVLLPALIFLGFWQMERADDKSALASSWEQRRHQPARVLQGLETGSPEDLAYLPVELTGRFLAEQYLLLDNRIHGGRFGYEVLGLFELSGTTVTALVNRGWIEGDSARLELPLVPAVTEELTISGHVYVSPGSPYLLADQVLQATWPKRVQAVEMDKLMPLVQGEFDRQLFPYPVRIDPGLVGSLTVDWQIINVSPEKHTGYAVQWFTMAGVLGFFYLLRSSNFWQLVTARRRSQE